VKNLIAKLDELEAQLDTLRTELNTVADRLLASAPPEVRTAKSVLVRVKFLIGHAEYRAVQTRYIEAQQKHSAAFIALQRERYPDMIIVA
jgi:uncharacterized protein (DUF3084 family)